MLARYGLVLLAAVAAGCGSSNSGASDVQGAPSTVSLTGETRAIVDLTNAERVRAGLAPLLPEARLVNAAQIHVEQMVRAGRLAHDLPGAMYPTLEDRLRAAGYSWQAAGENIAYGQAGAQAVVADWVDSPAHRQNLLNPAFTQIGVHHARDAGGRPYFAQVFARPR